jgi:hypothetical protein
MLVSETPTPGMAPPLAAAEAARYALLRRLAPSMRHHLVVNLQPIGMIYEVMDRRLRAGQPDISGVQESANKINGFARAALNSCIDVVGWLAPDDTVSTNVLDGCRECAGMLATSLSFRGYTLRNEVAQVAGDIRRTSMRHLLTASLIYITDHQAPPATLAIRAAERPGGVALTVSVQPGEGEKGFASEPPYRAIGREDLLALAAVEGVAVTAGADGVTLVFPLVTA